MAPYFINHITPYTIFYSTVAYTITYTGRIYYNNSYDYKQEYVKEKDQKTIKDELSLRVNINNIQKKKVTQKVACPVGLLRKSNVTAKFYISHLNH